MHRLYVCRQSQMICGPEVVKYYNPGALRTFEKLKKSHQHVQSSSMHNIYLWCLEIHCRDQVIGVSHRSTEVKNSVI